MFGDEVTHISVVGSDGACKISFPGAIVGGSSVMELAEDVARMLRLADDDRVVIYTSNAAGGMRVDIIYANTIQGRHAPLIAMPASRPEAVSTQPPSSPAAELPVPARRRRWLDVS